jgi:glycosyltransferase involved in cell wall biosynthesis
LVGDDFSTDETASIISNFEEKNKDLLFHIKRKSNLGKFTGNGRLNLLHTLSLANGKYIAICDGDDYWTDPYKLQKQVDYLEANPSVSCCATRFDALKDDGIFLRHSEKHSKEIQELSTNEIISRGHSPTQTCTIVFRRKLLTPIPKFIFNRKLAPADWALTLWFSLKGKVAILPFCSSIYRMHEFGVWNKNDYFTNNLNILHFYSIMIRYVPSKFYKHILLSFYRSMNHYLDYSFNLNNLNLTLKNVIILLYIPMSYLFIPSIIYQLSIYLFGRLKLIKLI